MWKAVLTCEDEIEAEVEARSPEDAVRQLVVSLTNDVSPDAELYETVSTLMNNIECATEDNDYYEVQGGDFSGGFYTIKVYETTAS